jgi:hypothetical protein
MASHSVEALPPAFVVGAGSPQGRISNIDRRMADKRLAYGGFAKQSTIDGFDSPVPCDVPMGFGFGGL